MTRWRRVLLLAVVLVVVPVSGWAQSLTAASLGGVVRDRAGAALFNVVITLMEERTGERRIVTTSRDGRFDFAMLPLGRYALTAEQLGYRPVRVPDILLSTGMGADLRLTLTAVVPPVLRSDTVPYERAIAARGGAGNQNLLRREYPTRERDIHDVLRMSSRSTGDPGIVEGLPGELGRTVVDGIPTSAAAHPQLPGRPEAEIALPLSSFDFVALLGGEADVEWSEAAGTFLSAYTRGGTQAPHAEWFGDYSGPSLISSKYFEAARIPQWGWSGISIDAPFQGRNATTRLGLELGRDSPLMPSSLPPGGNGGAIIAIARDSFATNLDPYALPRSSLLYRGSAFLRTDWSLSSTSVLTIRANGAGFWASDPDLGPGVLPSSGVDVRATDYAVAATLASQIGRRSWSETRMAFDHSGREYRSPGSPATVFAVDGSQFGVDPTLPGEFRRRTIRAAETVHLDAGAHRLKFGGAFTWNWFDQSYGFNRGGEFFFSDLTGFETRRGVFAQWTGAAPRARFQTGQAGLFAQDNWRPAGNVELTAGARYERESIQGGRVVLNQDWLAQSGLANSDLPPTAGKLSPRVAVAWLPGGGTWLFRATAGEYYDLSDPGLLAEVIGEAGQTDIRRGVGSLGAWPALPDTLAAPVRGATLSLLDPRFTAPRARRVTLTVARPIGGGGSFRLAGSYRHTDFLPRRADLNLVPGATGHDQYGRPIYGSLVQEGALLAADPGSNRRLAGFDQVYALNADGFSDYYGATLQVAWSVGSAVSVFAEYTISKTRDNWLTGRGGGPERQLSSFPRGLNGADWADGRSDFDVPHSVSAGALLRAGPLTLTGLYRYRSGAPFTPGFRAGVDANGDGSAWNDAAFVDDTIAGVGALLAAWDCLKVQAGRFAERNSCRDPGVHTIDLRLSLGPVRVNQLEIALDAEGLNLVESDEAVRDHALYLVDGGRTISTDPLTGTVIVPLTVNPNFGKPLVRRSPGRMIRLGFRVTY